MSFTKKAILKYISFMLLLAAYFGLTINHSQKVNTDMRFSDQSGYIMAVKKIHAENYWYLGDRNRMPIYPYIQAIFYRPSMSDASLFMQGKIVKSNSFLVYPGTNSLRIPDTDVLATGIYSLRIQNNDKIISKKIIKNSN